MSNRKRLFVVGAILLLGLLGTAAAVASGNPPVDTVSPMDVDDMDRPEPEESDEASHPGDDAEDEAEGPDRPITGTDLDRASRVALDYIGGGEVTGTEVDDEESYYEIEVTRDDGR